MPATQTAPRPADLSDELAAGYAYPQRDALVRMTHATAVALFQSRRAFWLAVAAHHDALVTAGCTDAAYDATEARAFAAYYGPHR